MGVAGQERNRQAVRYLLADERLRKASQWAEEGRPTAWIARRLGVSHVHAWRLIQKARRIEELRDIS